jgi:hypothetical protein
MFIADETVLFNKYKNMVYKAAHATARHYYLDKDDAISEGYVLFCDALKRYDPAKGAFSTVLYNELRRMHRWGKDEYMNKKHVTALEDTMPSTATAFNTVLEFTESKHELSANAKIMLEMILAREWAGKTPVRDRGPTKNIMYIICHDKFGWSQNRVQKIWDELQQWWKSEKYVFC